MNELNFRLNHVPSTRYLLDWNLEYPWRSIVCQLLAANVTDPALDKSVTRTRSANSIGDGSVSLTRMINAISRLAADVTISTNVTIR